MINIQYRITSNTNINFLLNDINVQFQVNLYDNRTDIVQIEIFKDGLLYMKSDFFSNPTQTHFIIGLNTTISCSYDESSAEFLFYIQSEEDYIEV